MKESQLPSCVRACDPTLYKTAFRSVNPLRAIIIYVLYLLHITPPRVCRAAGGGRNRSERGEETNHRADLHSRKRKAAATTTTTTTTIRVSVVLFLPDPRRSNNNNISYPHIDTTNTRHGAHPDPPPRAVHAVASVRRNNISVLVAVVGARSAARIRRARQFIIIYYNIHDIILFILYSVRFFLSF